MSRKADGYRKLCERRWQASAQKVKAILESSDGEEQYRCLAELYEGDTSHLSSSFEECHPAFQALLGMGQAILPRLFADLLAMQGRAYGDRPLGYASSLWRIEVIARLVLPQAIPIQKEDEGRVAALEAAFICWGKEHGYLS